MPFDKIVGVDGTTYQFPTLVRTRIADNIETVGSVENLAVIDALAPALALKSNTTHNHTLASLTSNGIDELGDVEIGVVGSNGIALADKHTLQYESSTLRWRNKVASGGVTVSATPPATPIIGDAWFDSNDGTLYVYYSDGNSVQWVQVQANSALEGTILSRLGAIESYVSVAQLTPAYSPNYIINGGFDINQRSFTSATSDVFGFDRWPTNGSGGTRTHSAQTFPLGTVLGADEPTNFVRLTTAGQSSAGDYYLLFQHIEDVRLLASKTVTISFWAKANSGTPSVSVELGQSFGAGGSPSANVNVLAGKVAISSSWARYSVSVTVPSIAGKTLGTTANSSYSALRLWVSGGSTWDIRTNSLGIQNNTFDFWGVQVEEGSVATPFHRSANSVQGELAACQRYYYRVSALSAGTQFGHGWGTGTNGAVATVPLKVSMRTAPSSIEFSGLQLGNNIDGALGAVTGATLQTSQASTENGFVGITASSLTQRHAYWLQAVNASSFIGFSAEL